MLCHLVAPLVGAWIEIAKLFADKIKKGSLPSWERGLKSPHSWCISALLHVAPLVGAWIEIFACMSAIFSSMSLPSWERGLKSYEIRVENNYPLVAPLVGAWIEIKYLFLFILL